MKYMTRRRIISLVFPIRCPVCGKILPYNAFLHEACERSLSATSGGNNVCFYDEHCKPLIRLAKEQADGCAVEAAAFLMTRQLRKNGVLDKITIVTDVPPHKNRLARRGYSFPKLLAKEIARLSEKSIVYEPLLRKTRETETQKGLSRTERAVNLTGAFAVRENAIAGLNLAGGHVLVVDDVTTTGATLRECAEALTAAGFAPDNISTAAFAQAKGGFVLS